MSIPHPGRDEIILTRPQGRHLCNDRAHRNAGRLAEVIVTFGQFGEPGHDPYWRECWGRSFPMCSQCWRQASQAAAKDRPHLIITDLTQ